MLAVKATQNDAAADWLARLCDEHTIVVVLQNGVEQVEQVQPLLPVVGRRPRHRVVLGRDPTGGLGATARRSRPGAAHRARGRDARRAAARRRLPGGLRPRLHHRGLAQAVVNALAGFMALSGRRSGMFRRDDVAALSRRYVAECLAVARAEGARLPDERGRGVGRHVPVGTRRHEHVDPDRPGNPPADGMGPAQRGDHPQSPRARPGHPDQRCAGAAAGRGQRRARTRCLEPCTPASAST